jgi:hypothetical protein
LAYRKQKNFDISREISANFESICSLLGLKEREAAEQALREWTQRNRDESQKRLDLYAEKGITIIQRETVNIAIFQQAEILLAKDELSRLLEVLETGNPDCKHDVQLELAQALKKIQPVYVRTKNPELLELLNKAQGLLEK